jgi:molybdopterin-synthase adenylyltransferase
MPKDFAISIPEGVNEQLLAHLIREDGQEDLTFALWLPSEGGERFSCLVHSLIPPEKGDRQIHGNVSFNTEYFKRVCRIAMEKGMGVCFIHSHPYPGWQGMSSDDVNAETKMAPAAFTFTDLPLVGMTVGSDGTWSGRIWNPEGNGNFKIQWAYLIKAVGKKLIAHFNYKLVSKSSYREEFKRTRTVYGADNHQKISKLTIGIVGLGSVGSFVAESLARMGIEKIVLIDFDKIEKHNLDRQLGALRTDIGTLKVDVSKRQIQNSSTASKVIVVTVPYKLSEQKAYSAALDCDIIFSCVDRPLGRYILNHLAYSHLIPVIDGGIRVSFDDSKVFESADWQFQTVAPEKPCLQCLEAYNPADVSLEKSGMLDKPSYLDGLPEDHPLKSNENVFPFSAHLASFEVFHLMALVTGIGNVHDFGIQRYRYKHGYLSSYNDRMCKPKCTFIHLVATGDKFISPIK